MYDLHCVSIGVEWLQITFSLATASHSLNIFYFFIKLNYSLTKLIQTNDKRYTVKSLLVPLRWPLGARKLLKNDRIYLNGASHRTVCVILISLLIVIPLCCSWLLLLMRFQTVLAHYTLENCLSKKTN